MLGIEFSLSGWSLIQRSPTERDHEASINEEALVHRGLLCHGEGRAIT